MKNKFLLLSCILLLLVASCKQGNPNKLKPEEVISKLEEKLIKAKEGDVIELPEGKFEFTKSLSVDKIAHLTIKGQGIDKTILSFKNQTEGAEGFKISAADNITISDMSVLDTKGDIFKVQECKGISFRNLKVGWTTGADSTNGSYGLYPVTCENVLVENCDVFGASDAGIYVGQSKNIIVRNNHVHENVAGIEIENSTNAEVYGNTANRNTGGICVFDMPDIPVKKGGFVRVYDNTVADNNLKNFAPVGNSVAVVPAGTGSFILSAQHVEFYHNTFTNHKTCGTAIISYMILGRPLKDSLYDPFYSGIYVHDNTYTNAAGVPDTSREMGSLLHRAFPTGVPEIVLDGIFDPRMVDATTGLPKGDEAVCIKNNGKAMVVNLDAAHNFAHPDADAGHYNCELNIQTDHAWNPANKTN
jgi:hypothetical protein